MPICYPLRLVTLLLLSTTALTSCSFPTSYKINIEQGNVIIPKAIKQLKPGMTRRQVYFVMGTPLIKDTFNTERWDYRYILRNGAKTLEEKRLSVFFKNDALINVTGTDLSSWASINPNKTGKPNSPLSDESRKLSTHDIEK